MKAKKAMEIMKDQVNDLNKKIDELTKERTHDMEISFNVAAPFGQDSAAKTQITPDTSTLQSPTLATPVSTQVPASSCPQLPARSSQPHGLILNAPASFSEFCSDESMRVAMDSTKTK